MVLAGDGKRDVTLTDIQDTHLHIGQKKKGVERVGQGGDPGYMNVCVYAAGSHISCVHVAFK